MYSFQSICKTSFIDSICIPVFFIYIKREGLSSLEVSLRRGCQFGR